MSFAVRPSSVFHLSSFIFRLPSPYPQYPPDPYQGHPNFQKLTSSLSRTVTFETSLLCRSNYKMPITLSLYYSVPQPTQIQSNATRSNPIRFKHFHLFQPPPLTTPTSSADVDLIWKIPQTIETPNIRSTTFFLAEVLSNRVLSTT